MPPCLMPRSWAIGKVVELRDDLVSQLGIQQAHGGKCWMLQHSNSGGFWPPGWWFCQATLQLWKLELSCLVSDVASFSRSTICLALVWVRTARMGLLQFLGARTYATFASQNATQSSVDPEKIWILWQFWRKLQIMDGKWRCCKK